MHWHSRIIHLATYFIFLLHIVLRTNSSSSLKLYYKIRPRNGNVVFSVTWGLNFEILFTWNLCFEVDIEGCRMRFCVSSYSMNLQVYSVPVFAVTTKLLDATCVWGAQLPVIVRRFNSRFSWPQSADWGIIHEYIELLSVRSSFTQLHSKMPTIVVFKTIRVRGLKYMTGRVFFKHSFMLFVPVTNTLTNLCS